MSGAQLALLKPARSSWPDATRQRQPISNGHHASTHPTAWIALATTGQPHSQTRRARAGQSRTHPAQNGVVQKTRYTQPARPRQATAKPQTSRPRAATTTAKQLDAPARPGRSKTNPTSDILATTRPGQQRLTKTGCAHRGLRTRSPTQNTSPIPLPRTRQRELQHKRPKPTIRRLTQPCTNQTAAEAMTQA